MSENDTRFCMAVGPAHPGRRGTRAAVLKDVKWAPGQEIIVKFVDGSEELRARVRAVAQEWTAPGAANLTFTFVDDGPADIRIAFVQGDGSWSTIGTVCQQVDQSEHTMNFGWLTPDSSDEELRPVTLHEFGHAVGLIHEHQNPQHPISWNRDAVIHDLSGPPNNWDEATIEHNMFEKYEPRAVVATDTDATSIMMYPIPLRWTTDGFSVGLNTEISAHDRELVRQVYER